MKKQIIAMALLLTVGSGAAMAQNCCEQKGNTEKKECGGSQKSCSGEKSCGGEKACGGEKSCGQDKANALDVIMTRTSIRKFTDEKVKPCCVEKMLRAAMAAPTAVNKQPWHFVVVDQKEALDALAGQGRRGDMLRNAPLAIVVCGDMTKALDGPMREFWVQDTSAATENLLLAAHALGLGAVWTGLYPDTNRAGQVAKVLGMPETIMPLCTDRKSTRLNSSHR